MKIKFKNGSTIENVDSQEVARGNRANVYWMLDDYGIWWQINHKTGERKIMPFESVDSQGV